MGEQKLYAGLPASYLRERLHLLEKRGDLVREYQKTAIELRDSLTADIGAGRQRSAIIHLRSFVDYCLTCLFVAYPASEADLDRKKLPKDLVEAADQIIKHRDLPVPAAQIKELEKVRRDLSQAAHGSVRALGSLDRWAADCLPCANDLAEMLMGLVAEADRRLNAHRG